VGAMFVCVFEQRAGLIANSNAARLTVANHEVRLSRLSTVGFHPLGSSTVKWQKIGVFHHKATSDSPFRDRVGWPSLLLLVFPQALSGRTTQPTCCEQLYYDQPYCDL